MPVLKPLPTAMAATATFHTISDPVTGTWSNYALSGDGTVMAANYGGEIYRWTAAGGFEDLGPGDPYSSSIGISRDGSTIISGYIGSDGFSRPALWNASGLVDLGHPHNGCTKIGNSWGSGYGVSANGKVAVGLAWTCTAAEGFEWTAKTGNLSLGHPAGNHSSRASAISANGKTIVGFWEDPTGPRRPVRWVGGKHDLFLGAKTIGEATAVNSDGTHDRGTVPGRERVWGCVLLFRQARVDHIGHTLASNHRSKHREWHLRQWTSSGLERRSLRSRDRSFYLDFLLLSHAKARDRTEKAGCQDSCRHDPDHCRQHLRRRFYHGRPVRQWPDVWQLDRAHNQVSN